MPLTPFHPAISAWFRERVGTPSAPQELGWPKIRSGAHTLIAAPTGTGKTLAAFLWALDGLLRQGDALRDETAVLYVSPLKALGNDVQKNLAAPLAELREREPSFPEVRVLVRTGDTPAKDREGMRKKPPHVLVTTPESLYILLTSDGGRNMLKTVRSVIVDEIHAMAGDKRGAHLALSLERLEALVGHEIQRIGLSATQKPIEDVAKLLVGVGRECATVDVGHVRKLELDIELPESPLSTVCSTETWDEIIQRMATLVLQNRTTLIFVNTRKLSERISARLQKPLGEDAVASHHGSLSRERRLEAERRLKAGELRALVATASLELGIDIGDVDLVLQVGATPTIAALLQRVGRSGHALSRTPRGKIFPLTEEELVVATAMVDAVRRGELDRTPKPSHPLDVLAQQVVAACVPEPWDETALYDVLHRSWPYRDLERADFDSLLELHSDGRRALLHRDQVNGRVRGTKRARLTAITGGGAIPDNGQYRVLVEPESTPVGTLDEDFAVESNVGDVFQLGNASWRVLKVEPGVVRVADAQGQPPTIPFWLGEGPARSRELSEAVSRVRTNALDPQWTEDAIGASPALAHALEGFLAEGRRTLGVVPTTDTVVAERFFDESGGMQLVLHAPFGGRINRAWGLALRKRFCVGFGFELQAAANEDAILISLGPVHSFPLEDVFGYLQPETAKDVLVQALLAAPMFGTRWRWNLTRSLLLARTQMGGKRVPTPLLRMRAEDALAQAFPQVLACPETLTETRLPVPWEHPIVRQTIEDCLHEAMDIDGFLDVLARMKDGRIRKVAVDTPEPSAFARGILNAMPYTFLDDAPLEERRTQAVLSRRNLDDKTVDSLGMLDPDAVERVRAEAWPDPEHVDELHEALLWMGYVTPLEAERSGWAEWLDELARAGRAVREGDRWFAAEATRVPVDVLRGRMEALGPIEASPGDEALLLELESRGAILRCRIEGRAMWCERRLLARIQRQTLERLRREIEPVTAAEFWRFLAAWQHTGEHRLEGPKGVLEVVRQLAGFEIPAASWEASVLPDRVRNYRREWLDELALTGAIAWGRLWGEGNTAVRRTPLCLLPREDLDLWLGLADTPAPLALVRRGDPVPPPEEETPLSTYAKLVLEALDQRGASFAQDLQRASRLLPEHFEAGLTQLIGHGLVTCDSFGGLRRLITPPSRRSTLLNAYALTPQGRWSRFRGTGDAPVAERAERVARVLLRRYGVVFRRMLERERIPLPWRELVAVYRRMELRGDVRGGRFVQRFAGEQYALPEAVETLRTLRRKHALAPAGDPVRVAASDPLNLEGVLTPEARIPAIGRHRVAIG